MSYLLNPYIFQGFLSNSLLVLDAGNTTSYSGSGTTWYDLSGRGNNATMSNCTYGGSGTGAYLIFNGTNSTANVPASSDFNISSKDFTITMWCYGDSAMGTSTVYHSVSEISVPSNDNFYHGIWRSGLYPGADYSVMGGAALFQTAVTGGGGAGYLGNASSTYSYLNKWTNVVFTRQGSNAYMYLNGSLWASRTFTAATNVSNYVYIGGNNDGNRSWWGNISLYAIHDIAMTGTEILNYYNLYKSRYGL